MAKGTVRTEQGPETDYWVRWTEKHPEHHMLFVVIDPQSKRPVASLYSIELNNFMVVGPDNEFVDLEMLDHPFSREEIIGTPLAKQIFSYLDEIFLNDQAITEFVSSSETEPGPRLNPIHLRIMILLVMGISIYLLSR